MKKDFSQEFGQDPIASITLIVQNSTSGKFLLFNSTEQYEEDSCHILNLKVDTSKNLSLQLARYLFENHLSLISYRTLVEATDVCFSLIDETPGTESFDMCLYAKVDVIDEDKLNSDTEVASFVELPELLARLSVGPCMDNITGAGIARLITEWSVLEF